MLMFPNIIIWTKNRPKDYEKYAVNENKILLTFERIGEILVLCVVLVFTDVNFKLWSIWSWWLIVSFIFMIFYEIYWVRYFRSKKKMKDFIAIFRYSCCRYYTSSYYLFIVGCLRKKHCAWNSCFNSCYWTH
jgi:hypothetical protein